VQLRPFWVRVERGMTSLGKFHGFKRIKPAHWILLRSRPLCFCRKGRLVGPPDMLTRSTRIEASGLFHVKRCQIRSPDWAVPDSAQCRMPT
jgi:hypothetical protein